MAKISLFSNPGRLLLFTSVFLCYADFLVIKSEYHVVPAITMEYPTSIAMVHQNPFQFQQFQVPLLSQQQTGNEIGGNYEAVWTPGNSNLLAPNYGGSQVLEPLPMVQTTAAAINYNYEAEKVKAKVTGVNYGPPEVQSTPVPSPTYGPAVAVKPEPSNNYGVAKPLEDTVPAATYGSPVEGKSSYAEIESNALALDYKANLGLTHSIYAHSSKALGSPLVAKLRERVHHLNLPPWYTTDIMLARYIESVNHKVEHAVLLLERTARWRKNQNIDWILEWEPPHILTSNFPYECSGLTDDGLPVIYLPIGKWNFKAVRQAGLANQISKYFTRILEEMRNATVGRYNPKTGKPLDQVVIVENLEGFRLSTYLTIFNNYGIIIKRYLRNFDRHYPFLAKRYIALRTPLTVQAAWTIFRRITPRLRQVLQVYNRFSIRGPADLAHAVPKNAIPTELGGTFASLVSHGLVVANEEWANDEQVW